MWEAFAKASLQAQRGTARPPCLQCRQWQQRLWPRYRARCSLSRGFTCVCHRCCCGCAQIDSNKDGRLSVAEIQQALGADANEVQQMIAEVDSDGDGQVDFDEFITLWSMRSENDSAAAAAAAKKA